MLNTKNLLHVSHNVSVINESYKMAELIMESAIRGQGYDFSPDIVANKISSLAKELYNRIMEDTLPALEMVSNLDKPLSRPKPPGIDNGNKFS